MMLNFSKNYNNKARFFYLAIFFICIVLIFIQKNNNYSFFTHINKLLLIKQNINQNQQLSIQNLEEQNLILKSQLHELQTKINIKNNLNKKYQILSTLNMDYISINQNGAFIVANSDNNSFSLYDLVVDRNGFLIGKIVAINKQFNLVKIQMIIDGKSFIPVKTQKTSTYGVLSNNSFCENGLSFENSTGNIENGETIMTSGEENLTPYGILIGKIDKQDKINCVKHFAQINNTDNLSVIKTKSYQELEQLLKGK